jgi:hypothetical protein
MYFLFVTKFDLSLYPLDSICWDSESNDVLFFIGQ